MATLNLGTYDVNTTLSDLNDSLGVSWGYSATLPNGDPNPETKAQFNRRQVGRIIREAYRDGKRKILLAEAEAAVPDITVT